MIDFFAFLPYALRPKRKSFLLVIGENETFLFPPENESPVCLRHQDPLVKDLLRETKEAFPHAPCHVLVNLQTEEVRTETLPAIGWIDRKKIAHRKLNQLFKSPFAHRMLRIKRHAFFAAALHQSDVLSFWMESLDHLDWPCPSVHIVSCEMAALLPKLLPEAGSSWDLLLFAQGSFGWRQIVTYKNLPVFTRLTPFLSNIEESSAQQIIHDMQATRAYLPRLGFQDTDTLNALIIASHTLSEQIKRFDFPFSLNFFSANQIAKKLNLPVYLNEEENDTTELVSAFFRSRKAVANFSKPTQQRLVNEDALAKSLVFIGCIALFAALLNIAQHASPVIHDIQSLAAIQSRVTDLRHEETSTHPLSQQQSQDLNLLQQALDRKKFFAEKTPSPFDLTNILASRLLPSIRLNSLEWKHRTDGFMQTHLTLHTVGTDTDPTVIVNTFKKQSAEWEKRMTNAKFRFSYLPFGSLSSLPFSYETEKQSPISDTDASLEIEGSDP